MQVRWERRTLSVLGLFVPYYLNCVYDLSEAARDRLLVKVPEMYNRIGGCQGFLFEQEPVFTYKSSTFVTDPGTGLWVVAYTERVVRLCAALLLAVYAEFRLWYVPPDVIGFARDLGMGMKVTLGSHTNVREVMELLEIIESTDFTTLPEVWRDRNPRPVDFHRGGTGRCGDYLYYDTFRRQEIDATTASSRVAATQVVRDDVDYG